jgi:hypothetical protein
MSGLITIDYEDSSFGREFKKLMIDLEYLDGYIGQGPEEAAIMRPIPSLSGYWSGLVFAGMLILTGVSTAAASRISGTTRDAESEWLLKGSRDAQSHLCYLEVSPGASGWFAMDITSSEGMDEACRRRSKEVESLVIPVFPSVYSPGSNLATDKPYFDTILGSGIVRKGDKVLVVGPGSGADAWTAWLRCGTKVFAVDINPVAVANTRSTARLAGFPVKTVTADIIEDDLPEDFSGFDVVLWNMPMLNERNFTLQRASELSHDGDDGRILDGFLLRLPQLLKNNGKAVIWNSLRAVERIKYPCFSVPFSRFSVIIITNSAR